MSTMIDFHTATQTAKASQRRFFSEGIRLYGDVDDLEEQMEQPTDDARFLAAKAAYIRDCETYCAVRLDLIQQGVEL